MIDKSDIESIVKEYIGESEIFLVEISVNPGNVIHVQIDKPEGINIDECVDLNRYIVEKLDKEVEDYELGVSSPGLGSPLKVLPQYLKNIGQTVEIVQNNGLKVKGLLLKATNEEIEVEIGKKIKMEGKKRPEIVFEPAKFKLNEIKSTRVLVSFK